MEERVKEFEEQTLEAMKRDLEDWDYEDIDILYWAKDMVGLEEVEDERGEFDLEELGIMLIAYGRLHKKYGKLTLEKLNKG